MKRPKLTKFKANEIQEIISAPPRWLIRWGVTLALCLLAMFGFIAKVIIYPDIVKTSIVVFNMGFSHPVSSDYDGVIKNVLVKDHQRVKKNQLLLTLKTRREDSVKIFAPRAGIIQYIGLTGSLQPVQQHQELFYLDEPGRGFYGNMPVPAKDLSKVKVFQKVVIRLVNLPHNKHSILHGVITQVAKTANSDGTYLSRVAIDDMQGQNISMTDGLSGQADIICRDLSLLDRIKIGLLQRIGH